MNVTNVNNQSEAKTSYLELPGGRRLAYHFTQGSEPGVMFLGGFKSDMTGSKALALEAFCRLQGRRFLRFDYTGHGQSSGDFRDGTIGDWARDATDMLDHIMGGRCILAGSSMGGWIMLLVALARADRIAGLLGIASAPDFTEKLIWEQFSQEQKKQLEEEGEVPVPDCYGAAAYPITAALIAEGRSHLLLDYPVPLDMPVRLVHGTEDEDVPYQFSERLAKQLRSNNVSVRLVEGGKHRLSEPDQLQLICEELGALLR